VLTALWLTQHRAMNMPGLEKHAAKITILRCYTLTPKEDANAPRPPTKPWPTALNFQSPSTR